GNPAAPQDARGAFRRRMRNRASASPLRGAVHHGDGDQRHRPAMCRLAAQGNEGAGMTATRIDRLFAGLKAENRPALVTYFMGGDPDYETSLSIMKALPGAGADVIELGMPFSDP